MLPRPLRRLEGGRSQGGSITVILPSPRIPDVTSLDEADRLATAEELAAALDEAQGRGAHRISIGSGRRPAARSTAHALAALWRARGGTVVDSVDWPDQAASWLRQANRFADGRPDAWLVVGTGRGWPQMLSRLLRSTHWRPGRTIVVASGEDTVSSVLAAMHGWDLTGLTTTTRGGELWLHDRLGRRTTA